MMNDPRMKAMGAEMPFDGRRMIYGGFAPVVEDGARGRMGYVDGSLLAVPSANKAAYSTWASKVSAVLQEHGAVRVVDAWGDRSEEHTSELQSLLRISHAVFC